VISRKADKRKEITPATSAKGCLFFLVGCAVIVMSIGAVRMVGEFRREHPALFWTVVVILTGILAGAAAWGVMRWVRKIKK
jgi:hypothetical protein